MKKIFYTTCFLFIIIGAFNILQAQSSNQNYIRTRTMQNETGTLFLDEIEYFDGLGRSVQTVKKGFNVLGQDIVLLKEYDNFGRIEKEWLPIPVGAAGGSGTYINPSTIHTLASTFYSDNAPYSKPEYEPSPLNRVKKRFGAGADWHNNNKAVTTDWLTNNSSSLKCYNYQIAANNSSLQNKGLYANNQLYVTKTTDEDGHYSYIFTDKQGQKILERRVNTDGNYDTYYVYDNFGDLRYVLPPLAADNLKAVTTWTENNTTLKKYAYIYYYDDKKRMIKKKLPGCQPVFMVYDKADRLVLLQDGNMRQKNNWQATKYDAFGRVITTGVVNLSASHSSLRNTYKNLLVTETYNNGAYSNNHFAATTPLTVNYYDDYAFISDTKLQYVENTEYGIQWKVNGQPYAKAMPTGTKVYQLNNPANYVTTAMYYDEKGNTIQTRASNHLGGYDITYNKYDFTGKILKTRKEHNIAEQAVIPEIYTYTYDHANRLIQQGYQIGNNPVVNLFENQYDQVGRLMEKRRHNIADVEQFEYNIRNWTTKIKSGNFEEHLYYNANLPSSVSNAAYYNGNIAYSTWTYNGIKKGYGYEYDYLNRYICSNYYVNDQFQYDMSWTESFSYDKHGNTTGLARFGGTYGDTYIDCVFFEYNGNQLKNALDEYGSQNQYNVKEYQDKANESVEFLYDDNGNMTTDLDRDIVTIRYNILNLPDTIQFKNGNQIVNFYDATGTKIGYEYFTLLYGVVVPLSTGQIVNNIQQNYGSDEYDLEKKDFIADFTYSWHVMSTSPGRYDVEKVYNPEGYTDIKDIVPKYYYYRKDHLGNNREVWCGNNNTTVQRTQYYPSGLPWAESTGTTVQNRKYNGKEFIEMHGYDTYDYGARGYYPAIMRFTTVDPMAEEAPGWSPYRYGFNNPIKFIDPNGMLEWNPEIDEDGNVVYIAEQGDNAQTLSEQYGISQEQAEEITGTRGTESIVEGTKITGDKVKEVTGSEVMKMDWQSSRATDSRMINQVLFAMEYSMSEGMFKTQDFFKNIPYLHSGKKYGFGGAAFLVGETNKITGENIPVQMMLDHKNRHPIETTPGGNNNWYVPHQKYYYARYEAQSGAKYPTVPMFIKFKGHNTMDAFSKKFGFKFSGITR